MNRAVKALQRIRGLRRPFAAILVLIVAMPIISVWATYRIGELSDRVAQVDEARLQLARALRYTLDEETGVRGYADTGKEVFLQPYEAAHPRIEALMKTLPATFAGAGLTEVLPQLNDIARLHEVWHVNVAAPLLANPRRPDALTVQEAGKRIIDQIRADVEKTHATAAAYAQAQSRAMTQVLVVSAILAMLWIAIVGMVTLIAERRAIRRETDLVMSLVAEREAVQQLSEWRSRLLAMLAHDFKSQLAVIIGAAHLLEDFPQRRGDPELLGSVRAAGYTLAEMADNALLLARAQESRLVLQRTLFDVGDIVDSVVQRYGTQREIRVYTGLAAATIEGDRSYVTRVMDNIIGNAVKYSELPVDVNISEEAENICVSVTDRGVGISDADLPHIFEEFWRSENTLWSKKGSGVGLFIVKKIMEAHGSNIRVASQVGKGTTVTLRFPRALHVPRAGNGALTLPETVRIAT